MPDANDPNYLRAQARYKREQQRVADQTAREARAWGRGFAWQNEEQPKAGRKIPKRGGLGRKALGVFKHPRNKR